MYSEAQSTRVLGSRIHMINLELITSIMDQWIQDHGPDGRCHRIVVTGFHGIWEAHKNDDLKAILNSADLWVPDGIAPVWVARYKGLGQVDRTPGLEVMRAFFELANRKGYRSFFYGDTEETLAVMKAKVSIQYPNHGIVGSFSPPFRPLTKEEDEDIIQMINTAKPDVLWVGLGCPKQDRWIFEHCERLHVPIAAGVGAAFNFLSDRVKPVPEWIGRNGLESIWRFVQEPKKLWRRDIIDGPQFVAHVLMELSGLRTYGNMVELPSDSTTVDLDSGPRARATWE